MAADKTGARVVTETLVAATARKINLTGSGNRIRITHHGGAATQPVFCTAAPSESALVTASVTANDNDVAVPGHPAEFNVPRGRGAAGGVWLSVISAGTPGCSVELLNAAT